VLGAELNAALETQTIRDSTIGPEQPLGQRGAEAADSVPSDSHDIQRT
jgi:membrane protein